MENPSVSLALIESLYSLTNELDDLTNSINDPFSKKLAQNITDKLKILVDLLDQSDSPVIVPNDPTSLNLNSIVYKLGIQGEVIKLRERGMTLTKIAEQFGLATSTISRFFKYYDYLSNLNKIKVRESSIMNSPERLEELFTMILRRLHALEGQNDEIHVQYIKELRQTIALASQVAEKMVNYKEYQRFTESVWELLKLELPEKRKLIAEKIALLQQDRTDLKALTGR